jgi:glycosyltransferase involved in cell wall biosynthesis
MNAPLVTLVLVSWNNERFVRDAVMSAVRQTYPSIQLIVFDNDSPDGSRRVIEDLRQEYKFQFIHQENVGLVKTLNRALKIVKGKYFVSIASDDIQLLDRLERQVAFLEANPHVDMVCGNTVMIDADGRLLGLPVANRSGRELTFKYLMEAGNGVQGPTVMVRTQALLEEGGYDESFVLEDYPLALSFARKGRRIVHTGELYTLWRRHANNLSNRQGYDEFLAIGRIYRETREYPSYVRKHFGGYFRMLAGERKSDAIRWLRTEPIEWSWDDVGIGMLKLALPPGLLRRLAKRFRGVIR